MCRVDTVAAREGLLAGKHPNVHLALMRSDQRIRVLALKALDAVAGFEVCVVVFLFVTCKSNGSSG